MDENEVELHSPGSMEVEKEYEVQVINKTPSRFRTLLEKINISKRAVLITILAIILFLIALAVILSISFGVGFLIGWGIHEANDGEYDYFEDYPYVNHSPHDYQLNRKDPTEALIYESNEYQFKLNVSLFKNDRMTGVRQLLILLRQVLNETLNEKHADIDVYTETQYSSTDCGESYSELRIRNYFGGSLDKISESDINKDANPHSNKASVMKYNLTPASQYLQNSEMKVEQDVHACWYKFNKKTKVKNLPTDFAFKTCGDVVGLYPKAFPNPSPQKPISKKSTTHFWECKFHGHLNNGSQYKLSFNLAYRTLDNALSGSVTPTSGESEFSIRLYSPDNGYAPWDYQILAEMGENYQYLLKHYGSTDYPCK